MKNTVTEYIIKSQAYKAYLKSQESILKADGLDYYPLSRAIKLFADKRAGRLFAITPTEELAKTLFDDLDDISDTKVVYLPSDGKLLYSHYSQSKGEYERKKAIEDAIEMKRGIVVASLRSFCSPLLSDSALSSHSLTLTTILSIL